MSDTEHPAWPSTNTPVKVVSVARAILKSRFYDCEPKAYASMAEFWESIYHNDHWMDAEFEARAAIEAMMEPSEEQRIAGAHAADIKPSQAAGVYRAMIRASLSQENRKP